MAVIIAMFKIVLKKGRSPFRLFPQNLRPFLLVIIYKNDYSIQIYESVNVYD